MSFFHRGLFAWNPLCSITDIAPVAVAKKYAGIGVSLVAQIKNTKTPFSIDFGVGDVIVPKKNEKFLLSLMVLPRQQ